MKKFLVGKLRLKILVRKETEKIGIIDDQIKIGKLVEKIRVSEKIGPRTGVKYSKLENLKNLGSIKQL